MAVKILEIERVEQNTIIRLKHRRVYQDVVSLFKEQVLELLDQGHNKIVFDLSMVEVMNSSGLGILILLQDRLDKQKGSLILTGLNPIMEQLFNQMKLETLFKVTKSEIEALELLQTL